MHHFNASSVRGFYNASLLGYLFDKVMKELSIVN